MTKEEQKAVGKVPGCVDLDSIDGTFAHVVFRVEHVVSLATEGEDTYTRREAMACQRWLKKHAPMSEYASATL